MGNDLELYQKESNSIWYTDKPVFCSKTGKQINKGIEIKLVNNIDSIGVFDWSLLQTILDKYLYNNEYIYLRQIISSALPVKKTRQIERGKLTYKLRFEVLQRDGFKCVKCGESASSVKIEIDHIIPISKGGLTIKSNLQTLCFKCNRGKSNGL
jgi:hypothetical protein